MPKGLTNSKDGALHNTDCIAVRGNNWEHLKQNVSSQNHLAKRFA